MHASTEQLLSLRDGDAPAPAVQAHLQGCQHCTRELERLTRVQDQLNKLPPIQPRQGLWQAVAVASLEQRSRPGFPWLSAIGIAASFILGLALIQRLSPGMSAPGAQEPVVELAQISEVVPAVEPVGVDALQKRSRQLESLRRAMPRRQGVIRASTARTIVDLQDRVALVDMRLNAAMDLGLTPTQQQALWRERVNLMQSLLQLEYAQIQSTRY
jgi:anti-sigma factor RsiW